MVTNERKAGVVLSYINILLNTAITLLYTPFVLRSLGQSEFGLYSLAMSIIAYLTILDLGFGNAIIVFTSKFIAKKEFNKEKTLHGTIFSIYLFMSALSILIGLFFYSKADIIFANSMSVDEIEKLKIMFIILTINIAFNFPLSIYISILNAYEKFIFIKAIFIVKSILIPATIAPLLLLGYKSVAMIAGITAINLLSLFVGYIYCKKVTNVKVNPRNFSFTTLKIVCSYSVFIFIGMIVDQINWNSGQFIIGIFLGSKEVGIYAIAILINTTFMLLSTSISGVMLPKVSKMVANNASNTELTDEMIKVGRLQQYIIFLILSGFILFGQSFLRLWAGSEYIDAYPLTIIAMIPLAIPLIQNLGLAILQAKNRYTFRAITALIGAVITIIISISTVKIYGYFGVAFATGIMFFIINGIVINIYYKKAINLEVGRFWLEIVKLTAPLFLLFIFCYIVKVSLNLSGALYLFVGIPLFTLIYCAIAYFLSMNRYEKDIILFLKNTVIKRVAR
ncbi:MAG: oligosaccharide flippase family protein [Campylobacter sp.]|nr:oligosaccharide flippase family protein [Campylobacter sp.]